MAAKVLDAGPWRQPPSYSAQASAFQQRGLERQLAREAEQ